VVVEGCIALFVPAALAFAAAVPVDPVAAWFCWFWGTEFTSGLVVAGLVEDCCELALCVSDCASPATPGF